MTTTTGLIMNLPEPLMTCAQCHTPLTPETLFTCVDGEREWLWCGKCAYPPTTPTLPDSGARTEFATGAVRDAMEGKGLPSMIPPIAIRAMAKRFEDGARKYGSLNFQKGIPLSRFYDSAMRHLMAWSEGDVSEEHLSAALWNLAVAMWTENEIQLKRLPQELHDLPYHAGPH